MQIIYLGNGPFAVPALVALSKSSHRVVQVVARPDRPQGKHQRIEPGPVAAAATELGLPLLQPPTVNDDAVRVQLGALGADLMVVADYGEILSRETLAVTPHGGINLHGSLLPKYRGAAPIVWAIANGEKETGVSVIAMSPKMDAGDVVLQRSIPIGPDATSGDIEPALADIAAQLALNAVSKLSLGTLVPMPQNPAQVTKAPKLKKEDGRIDWSRSADAIHNQVRAMNPWPVAFSFLSAPRVQRVRIVATTPLSSTETSEAPGTIIAFAKETLVVATGQGGLGIRSLQLEGKKVMSAADTFRGRQVSVGEMLGNFDRDMTADG